MSSRSNRLAVCVQMSSMPRDMRMNGSDRLNQVVCTCSVPNMKPSDNTSSCGVVEQREAAHQPGEVLGVHAATALERARLDEVGVRVDAGRRDIRIAAQVVLAVEYLEALQPRDGRSERPPVDVAHHALEVLDLRLLGRRLDGGGRGFRLVHHGRT